MNFRDSEVMASLMKHENCELTSSAEEADIILFNTCCVRENADQRLYGSVSQLKPLKQRNPNLIIAVGGCLAEKDKELMTKKLTHVDVVFGTHAIYELPKLISEAEKKSRNGTSLPVLQIGGTRPIISQAEFGLRAEGHRAWITVSEGCHHRCSFCIVPSVRGHERSKPVDLIMEEVRSAVEQGYPEICLLGQNINSYGRDLPDRPTLVDLFEQANEVDRLRRIRFATSNPMDMTDAILEGIARVPKVCEYLHLPLQSGSDRILWEMRRGYKVDRYRQIVSTARSLMPDLCMSTDLIVGFPGETDEDYEATCEVVREIRFDSAYVFKYSNRPGTRATNMSDQIPREVIEDRHRRLLDLQKSISREVNERMVGREFDLMIEAKAKEPGYLKGRTRNHKMALIKLPDREDGPAASRYRIGSEIQARIVGLKDWTLLAEPLPDAVPGEALVV